jgi:hypothetical protein
MIHVAEKKHSFMGWLGRQFGHVKKAVKTPVPEIVYRKETVQEAKVEGTDHLLRRTTVDEVIVEAKKSMGETPMPRKEDHGVQ